MYISDQTWVVPEGASKLHEKWLKCPWSLLCYHVFSFLGCTYGLMGSSLRSVDRGRAVSFLVYRLFCRICRHHLNTSSCSTTAPLWDIREGHWWKKNPPRGQNFRQCNCLFTLLRRRSGHMGYCILIHGLWPMVWLGDQGLWEEHVWKIDDKEIWEEIWRYISLNGQKSEDICVTCECSPKSDLSRGGL